MISRYGLGAYADSKLAGDRHQHLLNTMKIDGATKFTDKTKVWISFDIVLLLEDAP